MSKRVCSGMKVCFPEAMAWEGQEGMVRLGRSQDRVRSHEVCCARARVSELHEGERAKAKGEWIFACLFADACGRIRCEPCEHAFSHLP